jgi:hypothetical protein
LLGNVRMANDTTIGHAPFFPEWGMALSALAADLLMGYYTPHLFSRDSIEFAWTKHGAAAGECNTGEDESRDDGGYYCCSGKTSQAIIQGRCPFTSAEWRNILRRRYVQKQQ